MSVCSVKAEDRFTVGSSCLVPTRARLLPFNPRPTWPSRGTSETCPPPRGGYPSDLSDARWELIEPTLTAWRAKRRRRALDIGRPPEHDLRNIMNAILYVDHTGIPWHYLPHDFTPWATVYGYFAKCDQAGVFVQGVGRIGLAVPAGGQEPGPGGEGGGHVHHVLAGGGRLLSEAAAETLGSFDGEAALGPPLAPAHQLPDGPCADDEAPLGELVSCGVDGDGGVGRLAGVDTDPGLRGGSAPGGDPDLVPLDAVIRATRARPVATASPKRHFAGLGPPGSGWRRLLACPRARPGRRSCR